MQYLHYAHLDEITHDDQRSLALDLALAALVGPIHLQFRRASNNIFELGFV